MEPHHQVPDVLAEVAHAEGAAAAAEPAACSGLHAAAGGLARARPGTDTTGPDPGATGPDPGNSSSSHPDSDPNAASAEHTLPNQAGCQRYTLCFLITAVRLFLVMDMKGPPFYHQV